MTQSSNVPATRNQRIVTSTLWNVSGIGAPLIVAVFSIPFIVAGLGTERFGLLALAWTVIGYFGAFDFGLGVATTKFIAEFQQQGRNNDLRSLLTVSTLLHLALGLLGGCLLALLTGWLVGTALNVPPGLQAETKVAFHILSASIPVIVVTASFRGALEGMHRFDLVNMIKIPASVANYVSPLLVLSFTTDLAIIVATIALIRVIVLICYAALAIKAIRPSAHSSSVAPPFVSALLRYGGWLSVTNFVTPIMVSIDRFLIGAFISASAIAYYAVPYEIVTKLWIFSAGLLGVLMPVFSALSADASESIRRMVRQATRILLAVVAPLIGLLLALCGELLTWWVGDEFRQQSTAVSRWIAIGMLFNILAQVPLTALHGIGRTDVTAKILCVEILCYSVFAWFMVNRFGIDGVAFAWAARALVDALLLFTAARLILPGQRDGRLAPTRYQISCLGLFLFPLLIVGVTINEAVALKVLLVFLILAGMVFWEWRYLLMNEERKSVIQFHTRIQAALFTRKQP